MGNMMERGNRSSIFTSVLVGLATAVAGADEKPAPGEKILFDFEDPVEITAWSSEPVVEQPATKRKNPSPRIEQSSQNASSGKHSLKITFAGKQENHGFMLHGDSFDYMRAHFRESSDLNKRPAILVVYVPLKP